MTGEGILDFFMGNATQVGISEKNTNDTKYRKFLLDCLNNVKDDIANRQQSFHWRWLEKTATMPTVADQHSYDMPSDLDTNKILNVYDRTNDISYTFKPYDWFVRNVPDPSTNTGSPWIYTYFATTMRLYPVPSSVITVYMDYVKTLGDIADSSSALDIPDKYRDVVISGLLKWVYQFDPDLGDIVKQTAIYEAGIDRMIRDNNQSPGELRQRESHRGRSRTILGPYPLPIGQ